MSIANSQLFLVSLEITHTLIISHPLTLLIIKQCHIKIATTINPEWYVTNTTIDVCSQVMTIMFEVQDLAVASPATVSRCGMVYLEPSILGLAPFVRCWLNSVPETIRPHRERLETLFTDYLEVCTL